MRINTNISALNAERIGITNNRNMGESLEKLSSGHQINKAADNSSGMAIADSLRVQAHSLGQSIRNANDAIGIIQTADKAMDEQVKILDTVKTKAIQAAQDGQSKQSRKFIQEDIRRLIEELDNIASSTSYNGLKLLSGQFNNKEFEIGANSHETIKASIGATSSGKIGSIRLETGSMIKHDGVVALNFKGIEGNKSLKLQPTVISTSSGTGLGALVENINKTSQQTGIRAKATVESTGRFAVQAGDIHGLKINGYTVGDVVDVKSGDNDGRLVNAINDYTDRTGAKAFVDAKGRLHVKTDGRGLKISTTGPNSIKSRNKIQKGDVLNLRINGVYIGNIRAVKEDDVDGTLVAHINKFSSRTGVTARVEKGFLVLDGNKINSISLESTSNNVHDLTKVTNGSVTGLKINGINIGNVKTVTNDANGALVNAVNAKSTQTGVIARIDNLGRIRIGERKNRVIKISTNQGTLANNEIVGAQRLEGITINGVLLGNVSTIANDKDQALQDLINNNVNKTGVQADMVNGRLVLSQASKDVTKATVVSSHSDKLQAGRKILHGDYQNMMINGVRIDDVIGVKDSDTDNRLVTAINAKQDFTGVIAVNEGGHLVFKENSKYDFNFGDKITGSAYRAPNKELRVEADSGPIKDNESFSRLTADDINFGRLSLIRENARDITVSGSSGGTAGFSANVAQTTVNLRDTLGDMNKNIASAAGANANQILAEDTKDGMGVGVSTLAGAMVVMDVANTAIKRLDSVRASLGSSQQQLIATINNISVTEVNLKAGESQIRDLDFAKESSTFSKNKILTQSGNYALSQANSSQQLVLRLLK